MRKTQRTKNSNKRRVRASTGIRDPSFTHTLTTDLAASIAMGTGTYVSAISAGNLGGFPQLANFFECFTPRSYRIRLSYTNWSGTIAFVPLNPFTATVPSATSLLVQSLREVSGAVRVQQGFTNTGAKVSYPYPSMGWQCASISSNPIGYIAAYNDTPIVLAWTIQVTIEIDVRFYRRQLLNLGNTMPTLLGPKDPPNDDEEEKSMEIIKST